MKTPSKSVRTTSFLRVNRIGVPVSVAISFLLFGTALATTPQQSIEQRLLALEDRVRIEELVSSDYSAVIDKSDVKSLSALFTIDGEYSSEWSDITEMPGVLRAVFTRSGAWNGADKMRARVTFRGRQTIADFMTLVVTAQPRITVEDGAVTATFDGRSGPDTAKPNAPPPMPPPGKSGAPPKAPGGPLFSMRHVITNLTIALDGDRANATSYWTEISTTSDGKQSLAGGGYYTDVLYREGGAWRFKRRLIHNYDPSAPSVPPGTAAGTAH